MTHPWMRTMRVRTLAILAGLLLVYALLVVAVFRGPSWLEVPGAAAAFAPYLLALLLHKLGLPGVLEHNGLCGWGLCAPTPLGWLLAVALGLAALWLLAWALARLLKRR